MRIWLGLYTDLLRGTKSLSSMCYPFSLIQLTMNLLNTYYNASVVEAEDVKNRKDRESPWSLERLSLVGGDKQANKFIIRIIEAVGK